MKTLTKNIGQYIKDTNDDLLSIESSRGDIVLKSNSTKRIKYRRVSKYDANGRYFVFNKTKIYC